MIAGKMVNPEKFKQLLKQYGIGKVEKKKATVTKDLLLKTEERASRWKEDPKKNGSVLQPMSPIFVYRTKREKKLNKHLVKSAAPRIVKATRNYDSYV